MLLIASAYDKLAKATRKVSDLPNPPGSLILGNLSVTDVDWSMGPHPWAKGGRCRHFPHPRQWPPSAHRAQAPCLRYTEGEGGLRL